MDHGRARPEGLHDVDLTAPGPSRLTEILAEHPEGGPDPEGARDRDPRLHHAIVARHPVLADQPRGCVRTAVVWAPVHLRVCSPYRDGEMAGPVQRGVARAVGV